MTERLAARIRKNSADGAVRRIGLVSDTHGLYDPAVEPFLREVDEILHAGDVGKRAVLRELGKMAPVIAVHGNTDAYAPEMPEATMLFRVYAADGTPLPEDAETPAGGLKIMLTHILGDLRMFTPSVAANVERGRPHVIVFGHTHWPCVERRDERWLVNPGSCGPKRPDLPRTCAVMKLHRRENGLFPHTKIFDLETGEMWRDLTMPQTTREGD
jgi:hypothetical protein